MMLRKFFLPLTATLNNMRTALLRTFLTILGIVIGIASVTVVMSAGQSAQNLILDQLRGIGSNLIAILPGASSDSGPPAQVFGVVNTAFTNDDLEAIENPQRVPYVVAVAGYVTGSAAVRYQNRAGVATYQGVSPNMVVVENATVAQGRFFSDDENTRQARVAVIGSERAKILFGSNNPIGEKISIGGKSFRVIGTMRPRGALGFTNPDNVIFVPLLTAQKQLLGIDYLNFARIKVDAEENIAQAKDDIRAVLRARHDIRAGEEDDFSVRDLASALTIVTRITNVIKTFLIVVAAIALIVGGIGVMNVMFIVLAQRLREIGLRKALGATRGDIAAQFLTEAIIITMVGGIIGSILGIVITYGIAQVAQHFGYHWEFLLTWRAIGVAFVIAFGVGVLFGIYPARKAARVSPMEALRYE